MSAIKQHYHEEINRREDDHLDDEYLYSQWVAQSQKDLTEDLRIEEESERAAFFRTFDATGTYPM